MKWWFYLMHFGFALELSNVDSLNIDLLDIHLDLLDTDIPSKYFVCRHNVFKIFSRHAFKASLRHVFKTSSRHVFKTLRLQCNNFSSSKTTSRRLCQTSPTRLGRSKDVLKTCWRRLKDQKIVAWIILLFCSFLSSLTDCHLVLRED